MSQFESFRASELYCEKCGRTMAVREKLLLGSDNNKQIFEYLCSGCGASLGKREVSGENVATPNREEQMDEATRLLLRKGFPRA